MSPTWPIRACELLGKPVRLGAVEVGSVADVLASQGLAYVFGFEVLGQDGHTHFVPWVAADVATDAVFLTSVFSLLSSSELALYVDHGVRIKAVAPRALIARDGQIRDGDEPQAARAGASTSDSMRLDQLAPKRPIP
jgi:hypothetical protein